MEQVLRKTRERVYGDYRSLSAAARGLAYRVYHSFGQCFVAASVPKVPNGCQGVVGVAAHFVKAGRSFGPSSTAHGSSPCLSVPVSFRIHLVGILVVIRKLFLKIKYKFSMLSVLYGGLLGSRRPGYSSAAIRASMVAALNIKARSRMKPNR